MPPIRTATAPALAPVAARSRPPVVAPKPSAPPPFAKDTLSTGKGKALATKALATTGASSKAPMATSNAPTIQASRLQGGMPTPAPEVATAAASVDAAYKKGGAAAGARALADATAGKTPEVAAQINAAARPTVEQIVASLTADNATLDNGTPQQVSARKRVFDQTVADLSLALSRGATVPVGQVELAHTAELLSDSIRSGGLGRFDRALGSTVVGGPNLTDAGTVASVEPLAKGSTALATAVISQLKSTGGSPQAGRVLNAVNGALGALNAKSDEINAKVEASNQDLAYLVQNFGKVLDPKEIENAIAEFRKGHPEYAVADRLATPAIQRADELSRVQAEFKGLDGEKAIAQTLDASAAQLGSNAANSAQGALALEQLTLAKPGEKTLLDHASTLAKAGKIPTTTATLLASRLLDGASAAVITSRLSGAPSSAAIARLNRYAGLFGADGKTLEKITANLDEVVNAADQAATEASLRRLDSTLKSAAFTDTSGVSRAFRSAGFLLGVAGTAASISKAVDDPGFENIASALASAVGSSQASVALAKSVFGPTARLSAAGTALKGAGTYAGVVTTGISAFHAAEAFSRGDVSKGSLYAAQAAGGVLILAGSTGPGALVVAGTALALVQLDRVRASNRFEDAHTSAFLQGAGVSAAAAKQLRNADDNGRLVGDEIAAVAQRLGVDPRVLFDHIASLPPERVKTFVTTLHELDPQRDGSYPATAGNDGVVGESGYDSASEQYVDTAPHSLQGIINLLKRRGFDFASLAGAP